MLKCLLRGFIAFYFKNVLHTYYNNVYFKLQYLPTHVHKRKQLHFNYIQYQIVEYFNDVT